MAPVYKLKYFNMMGVAEPIRYMLAYGNVQYEDVHIEKNQFPVMRKSVPFGHIPVLEVDNKVLFQSVAICHFLGHRFGLVFDDEWMNAETHAIAETVCDFGTKVTEWYLEENQSMKTMLHKELDTHLMAYMQEFEKHILKNGGFFGGKMSWVDLYFVAMVESIEAMWGMKFIQNKYPTLHQLVMKVHAIPSVKAYLNKRPHYDH